MYSLHFVPFGFFFPPSRPFRLIRRSFYAHFGSRARTSFPLAGVVRTAPPSFSDAILSRCPRVFLYARVCQSYYVYRYGRACVFRRARSGLDFTTRTVQTQITTDRPATLFDVSPFSVTLVNLTQYPANGPSKRTVSGHFFPVFAAQSRVPPP